MVTRLQVRVLLDTGPTADEVAEIQRLFAGLGMDAEAEGHSYGGPPPTSAFLIVVTSPLVPLLDRVADPDVGGPAFARLVRRLQAMRADERRWGRPHGVKLEDAHSGHGIRLPVGLPPAAYQALAEIDLTALDRGAPPVELEWSPSLVRWQAVLATAPRRLARRVPARGRGTDLPRVRQLTEAEIGQLWRLVGSGACSAVEWQRASIVLESALGSAVAGIARRAMISPERVRAVIGNFHQDGMASLAAGYRGGEAPRPTPEQWRDAVRIAGSPPAAYGVAIGGWDEASLGEFLVGEGVVEDIDPASLESLLAGARARPERGAPPVMAATTTSGT